MSNIRTMILSIEGWRNPEGWDWNNQWNIGEMSKEDLDKIFNVRTSIGRSRAVLKWFRDNDFTTERSKGKLAVRFDGGDPEYIHIIDKNTHEPLFAVVVEYL